MKWYVGLLEGIMYISNENCFIGYGDKSFIDEGNYEDMIKKYPTAGISYEDVVMGIAKVQCETYRSGCEHYPIYLERIGFAKQPMPKKANGKKYTIDEFCKKIAEPSKSYVVSCANHLTCVKDKKIHDIWNCGYKCVGNYWEVL